MYPEEEYYGSEEFQRNVSFGYWFLVGTLWFVWLLLPLQKKTINNVKDFFRPDTVVVVDSTLYHYYYRLLQGREQIEDYHYCLETNDWINREYPELSHENPNCFEEQFEREKTISEITFSRAPHKGGPDDHKYTLDYLRPVPIDSLSIPPKLHLGVNTLSWHEWMPRNFNN